MTDGEGFALLVLAAFLLICAALPLLIPIALVAAIIGAVVMSEREG